MQNQPTQHSSAPVNVFRENQTQGAVNGSLYSVLWDTAGQLGKLNVLERYPTRVSTKTSFMILTQFWCCRKQTVLDEPLGGCLLWGHLSGKEEEGEGHLLSSSSGQTESAPLLWLLAEGVYILVSWDGRGLISTAVEGFSLCLFSSGLLLLQSWYLPQLLLQKWYLCLGIPKLC